MPIQTIRKFFAALNRIKNSFFYKDETTGSELSKSIAKVNVFLTDVNDNAPVFLKDSYEYELTDIYTRTLLWLNATDPDEGVNAQFDFALHGVTRVSRGYQGCRL